ncbi:MAG: helix-turn-helix domain-containing protein [Actinomycetota bacterium]|nr:helix-turn-helix domain-containing protein [Actinomycetota bacterium]
MSQDWQVTRGKFNPEITTSDGIFLGEADEVNRYHLRPVNEPKPLTLKGSTGKPTYGTLPAVLMLDKDLSSNAKVLWAYLHFRQGNNETAWPSQTTIQAHTNMSRSTISRATKDLEKLMWLRVFRTQAGTQRWNSYRVQIPDYATERINSSSKKQQKMSQKDLANDSNTVDELIQIDAVKTPIITPEKNTKINTHQSRLMPDISSMFHSIND